MEIKFYVDSANLQRMVNHYRYIKFHLNFWFYEFSEFLLESISFYLEWLRRYGVLKNVLRYWSYICVVYTSHGKNEHGVLTGTSCNSIIGKDNRKDSSQLSSFVLQITADDSVSSSTSYITCLSTRPFINSDK